MQFFIKSEGEGSRGGKVIGHTKSGKPIYEQKISRKQYEQLLKLRRSTVHSSQTGEPIYQDDSLKRITKTGAGQYTVGVTSAQADILKKKGLAHVDQKSEQKFEPGSRVSHGTRHYKTVAITEEGDHHVAHGWKDYVKTRREEVPHEPKRTDGYATSREVLENELRSHAATHGRPLVHDDETEKSMFTIDKAFAVPPKKPSMRPKKEPKDPEELKMEQRQQKEAGMVKDKDEDDTEKSFYVPLTTSDALRNLVKSGEGSRGGKVIGRTRSGKPIYDQPSHPSHAEFNKDDHKDAYNHHEFQVRQLTDAAGRAGANSAKILKQRNEHKDSARAHLRNT